MVLNYTEGPDNGSPFVILPAYDNRWQSYTSIIPHMETRSHLYGLDARGRGKSGRAPGRYKLIHSVEDTVAFLNHIVGEPSILFGHSNGGWMSLWVADRAPHLVKAVIYGDASLNIEGLIEISKTKEEMDSYRKFKEWSGKPVD